MNAMIPIENLNCKRVVFLKATLLKMYRASVRRTAKQIEDLFAPLLKSKRTMPLALLRVRKN